MPSGYSSREDPGQMKKNKQSMADLKLRRLTELNSRLREDLERERIPVSQAAKRYFTLLSHAEFFLTRLLFVATPVNSASLSLRGTSLHRNLGLMSIIASFPIPTAQKISWFRLSGVTFQRERTHMLSKPQAVSLTHLYAYISQETC